MVLNMFEVFQQAREALVRAAYRALLRREPDDVAVSQFRYPGFASEEENVLENTLREFVESEEFQHIRDGDGDGGLLAAWVGSEPWNGDFRTEARVEDIFFSFRLILGRLPHREEWPGHSSLVGAPLSEVVKTYLNSGEFKARNLLEVALPSGIVKRHNGRFVVVADENDLQLGAPALRGEYETHVANVMEILLKEGDCLLDVGANLGYFSLLAATLVGDSGCVYAVEPNEYNVKLLESSRRANRFNNIIVIQAGATDVLETLFLHATIGNGSTSSILDQEDPFSSRTAPGIPLDNLLSFRDRPINLIKIDVEGLEYKALLGAERILKEDRPFIIFEFQGSGLVGIGGREFLEFLEVKGYKFVNISSNRSVTDCQSIEEIMDDYYKSGVDHIDVLAKF